VERKFRAAEYNVAAQFPAPAADIEHSEGALRPRNQKSPRARTLDIDGQVEEGRGRKFFFMGVDAEDLFRQSWGTFS